MGLYTGVEAIRKVAGVSSDILIKVPFYDTYKDIIDFYESKGGYPKYHFLVDFLDIDESCGIENYYEDTEDNYNHFQQQYKEIVEGYERIVEEIEKNDLVTKFQSKELSFFKRNNELAEYLGKEVKSEEFHFRKIVHPDQLIPMLEGAKEAVGIDFSYTVKEIGKLRDEYDFEVHVS